MFNKGRQPPSGFDLDTPLLRFSKRDPWTIRDACQGTQIFGGTGSGKTSGSGQAIARAMLAAGFGGLVLTTKADERDTWIRYAQQTGRERSLIVFSDTEPHRFNFLEYERQTRGRAGLTQALVRLFHTTLSALSDDPQTGTADPFWADALKTLLRNTIDLVLFAEAPLSMTTLADIIATAPHHQDDLDDPRWRSSSTCWRCLEQAERRLNTHEPYTGARRDLETTARYWCREFPGMALETRSSVTAMFTSKADRLLRGIERELFCTELTITPEITQRGAVLIIDLPVLTHGDFGRFAQVLWKYCWQRSVERRTVTPGSRPVFLWADEAQQFVTTEDAAFQATARSSLVCTVYLTQTLSSYTSAFGPHGSQAATNLIGNLSTKIFHMNGDEETNAWGQKLIAEDWQTQVSVSSQDAPNSGNQQGKPGRSLSTSTSRALTPNLLAGTFIGLRSGGPANRNEVDAVVFKAGRRWNATGECFLQTSFRQEF